MERMKFRELIFVSTFAALLSMVLYQTVGFSYKKPGKSKPTTAPSAAKKYHVDTKDVVLSDTPAAYDPTWKKKRYPQQADSRLKPFPNAKPGDIVPQRLYLFTGRSASSWGYVDNIVHFGTWYKQGVAQKAKVMKLRMDYMKLRYNLSCKTHSQWTMARSKPIPVGPTVRLPKGVKSWEQLAAMSPTEIHKKGLFPEGFRDLSHPLHSTGHMLFPQSWLKVHPEDKRFDVDFDIPNCYLPEFPPPLFITTRPDLGDISKGKEITLSNFRELTDGVLTPEQQEGLRLMVTKFPTTWFNYTKHRVTKMPSRGISCFGCHVNGHTNGAIALDPGTRGTLARQRTDTPSLRGNYALNIFSLKRSIRSLDHFSEIEEYFDGDQGMLAQIGGRRLDKPSTNKMGDINGIIDFPPAPKLNLLGRLDHSKATAQEKLGEKLFFGKAQCSHCHKPPYYTDGTMHDLKAERFHLSRAVGPVKTPPLRGLKDSLPYLHDGRLLTIEDTVEYFNLILGTRLTAQEKKALTAFLRTL